MPPAAFPTRLIVAAATFAIVPAGCTPTARAALDPLPTPRGGVAAVHPRGIGACPAVGEEPVEALWTVECIRDDERAMPLPALVGPHRGHRTAVADGVADVLVIAGEEWAPCS